MYQNEEEEFKKKEFPKFQSLVLLAITTKKIIRCKNERKLCATHTNKWWKMFNEFTGIKLFVAAIAMEIWWNIITSGLYDFFLLISFLICPRNAYNLFDGYDAGCECDEEK